ncbi:UNVERIFIED_CONTAM: hypothetical protein NCL1_62239 [Trichonephila clavipes]
MKRILTMREAYCFHLQALIWCNPSGLHLLVKESVRYVDTIKEDPGQYHFVFEIFSHALPYFINSAQWAIRQEIPKGTEGHLAIKLMTKVILSAGEMTAVLRCRSSGMMKASTSIE